MKEYDTCQDCGVSLDTHNTKGAWRTKHKAQMRCGKCYLKWKKDERERNGKA
jgi:hypothetical protein